MSTQGVQDPVPILFRPQGHVILSGRNYLVPLLLDKVSLLGLTAPIKKALLDLREAYDKLDRPSTQVNQTSRSRGADTNDDFPMHGNIPLSIAKHIDLLLVDVERRQGQMQAYLLSIGETVTTNRPSRGVVDGGGALLSWLFGVATEGELLEQENIINRLESLTEHERRNINMHTHMLNVTTLHLDRLENTSVKVVKALGSVKSDLSMLEKTLERSEERHIITINCISLVSALSYAASVMTDLITMFDDVHEGLVSLRQGYLSSKIIPPEVVLSLVGELTINNMRPIWPAAKKWVQAYYQYTQVYSVDSKVLCFLMSIPLLGEPEVTLNLFQISSLPYPMSKDAVVSFGNLPEYFAISADRAIYIELANLKGCRKFRQTYVCPIVTDVIKETFVTCPYALYTNGNITEYCKKHLSGPLRRPRLIADTNGGWLYATSSPLDLTITCPDQTRTLTLAIGVGRLNLGSQCKITSKYSIIPASHNYQSPTNITQNFKIEFSLSLTLQEQEKITRISNDPLFKDLISLTGDNVPLDSLKGDLAKLNKIESNRMSNTTSSHVALSLSGIAVITLIIFCAGAGILIYLTRRDQKGLRNDRTRLARQLLLGNNQADAEEVNIQLNPSPGPNPINPMQVHSPIAARRIQMEGLVPLILPGTNPPGLQTTNT